MIHQFLLHLLVLIAVYSVLAVSLNVALGYAGLLNLGHVAFFGIGAYTSALLVKAGAPFLLSFAAAGVLAGLAGWFLVWATRKLKGDYLALATLAFSFVVYSVLLNWQGLTRGPLGIPGIPKPSLFGFSVSATWMYVLFAGLIAVASVYVMSRLVNSRFGRLLEAVRDDETGVSMLGKDAYALKVKAMVVSAFFAGLAGSLFAHYLSFIDPSSFYLTEIILILTIVIVGGLATVRGSVWATVILLLIPEALRFVDLPSSIAGPLRQVLYVVILIGILLWRPRGLFGRVDLA